MPTIPIRRRHPRALLRQAHRAAPCSSAAPVCPTRLFPRDFCSCPPPLTTDAVVCEAHQQFMVVGFGAWLLARRIIAVPSDVRLRRIPKSVGFWPANAQPAEASQPAPGGHADVVRRTAHAPHIQPSHRGATAGQGEDRDRQAFSPARQPFPVLRTGSESLPANTIARAIRPRTATPWKAHWNSNPDLLFRREPSFPLYDGPVGIPGQTRTGIFQLR